MDVFLGTPCDDLFTGNALAVFGFGGNDDLWVTQYGGVARGGSGNDTLQATACGVYLIGDQGNDELSAEGGCFLIGGSGRDTFEFDLGCGRYGFDTVLDFKKGVDNFNLAGWSLDPLDHLPASMFVIGTHAHDRDDRIIYDQKTGMLFFDPDGTGCRQQEHFATISNHVFLCAGDFLVG